MRKGHLTASKHHDIYTKVNTLTRSKGAVKPKTTPLVANIIISNKKLRNIAAFLFQSVVPLSSSSESLSDSSSASAIVAI